MGIKTMIGIAVGIFYIIDVIIMYALCYAAGEADDAAEKAFSEYMEKKKSSIDTAGAANAT